MPIQSKIDVIPDVLVAYDQIASGFFVGAGAAPPQTIGFIGLPDRFAALWLVEWHISTNAPNALSQWVEYDLVWTSTNSIALDSGIITDGMSVGRKLLFETQAVAANSPQPQFQLRAQNVVGVGTFIRFWMACEFIGTRS